MVTRKPRGGRSGAAAVEAAFILIPVMLIVFGIFQYGRLLMDWNVLNNAAREGCRYALVNIETDRVTNSLNTLALEIVQWVGGAADSPST